jgi:hypothetical protein
MSEYPVAPGSLNGKFSRLGGKNKVASQHTLCYSHKVQTLLEKVRKALYGHLSDKRLALDCNSEKRLNRCLPFKRRV